MGSRAASEAELDELRRRLDEAEASLRILRSTVPPPSSGTHDHKAAWLDSLVRSLPDGVALAEDGLIVLANARLAAILGAADAEALERRVIPEPEGESVVGAPREERWPRLDGTLVRLEVVRNEIVISGSRRTLVVVRDASSKEAWQAQIVQADRLAAIGSLASGVAHQINNPLAYVMANLSFLSDELPEIQRLLTTGADVNEAEARLREATHTLLEAREGADRVAAIVRDLKMLSRIDDDRREMIDLPSLLDTACNVVRSEFGANVTVVRDYGPTQRVYGNESRLGHVFANLVLNAAQALRESPDEAHEIRITTRTDEHGRPTVEIADTGPGMAPGVVNRVFDPFFTTKPVGVGVGLGLTTSLGIVTAMGGTIEVTSASGKGARFRVVLPVSRETPRQSSTMATVHAPLIAPRPRILIVDDEPTLTTALRRALVRDVEVVVRTSGREAVALLEADPRFDVVLCDIMMPDMTGIEVYEAVKERAPALAAKFVFMTGGTFAAATREFLDNVPNTRLEKPFDLRALRELIRQRSAQASG